MISISAKQRAGRVCLNVRPAAAGADLISGRETVREMRL